MYLRSGNIYSFKMPSPGDDIATPSTTATTMTTTTTTTTTPSTTTTTMTTATTTTTTTTTPATVSPLSTTLYTPTFKLLHHDPSIQKFGGEDISQYTPLQFLQSCEDSMCNSNIHTGVDKISFVRSQLQPGSIAADLMSASDFNPKTLNYDYESFRRNFLQAFGMPQQPDSFQWIFDGADSLNTNFGALNCLRALPRSAELASAAVNSLKASNWITNGTLSEQQFHDIIEFLFYVNFLSPSERRIASTLPYAQSDKLLDFSTKIANKLKERPAHTQVQYVASTSAAQTSGSPAANQTPQYGAQSPDQQRAVYSCTYCNKQGHSFKRCFLRQRHERNAARSPSAQRLSRHDSFQDSKLPQHSGHGRQRSASQKGRTAQRLNLERPPKSCLIHGPGSHSSEECFKILRLQRQQHVTVSSPQSNFYQRQYSPPTT